MNNTMLSAEDRELLRRSQAAEKARAMTPSALVKQIIIDVATTHPVQWGGHQLTRDQQLLHEAICAELDLRISPKE